MSSGLFTVNGRPKVAGREHSAEVSPRRYVVQIGGTRMSVPRDDATTAEAAVGLAPGRLLTRESFIRCAAGGVVAGVGLATLLSGCGSTSQVAGGSGTGTAPSAPAGTVKVAIPGFPVTLDPTLDGALSTIAVLFNVYETLIGFDQDYTRLVGVLAESWESDDDARVWRFTLRRGVRFHDGAPLDASAVRASIEYTLRRAAPFGPILIGAPRIDDSDPGVVVFSYEKPFPDLARNMTYASPIISPKLLAGSTRAAEAAVAARPVGTGPFAFRSVQPGRGISLRAFDGYWGETPLIADLEFANVRDESARVSALQAGDVDVVMQLPPRAAQSLRANSRVTVHDRPSWSTVLLMPACNQRPFDDVRVRQAMAYAIDRRTIVDKVLLGQATLDDSQLPQGVYGYVRPRTTYGFDPEKARALLKAAGYDSAVPIRFSTRADAVGASEITQAIAAQLEDVGFAVQSEVLDQAAYEADLALPVSRYQLHWNEAGWVNGGPFHMTFNDTAMRSFYRDRDYDALVAEVSSTPDGPRREQLIARANERWAEQAAWLTLWVAKRIDATSADIGGYRTPPNVLTLFGRTYVAQ